MRRVQALAAITVLLTLVACNPCSTTFSCEQSPRVAVLGQILDESSGMPVAGARIGMQRASGVGLFGAPAVMTTADDGVFQLEMLAAEVGESVVTIDVASPGRPPYQVLGVKARASVQTGEATVLRPWVSANPVFPWVVELFRNGTSDTRIVNSAVEFRRTGGVRMLSGGVEVNRAAATTNDVGWVFPFLGLTADAAGDVVGDLIVRLAPLDSAVLIGLHFPAVPVFGPQLGLFRLGAGPS
jgi:hypothetical protein